MNSPDPATVIDPALLWVINPLDIFINGTGWVRVLTEPQSSPCIWPHWDSEDCAILRAVYKYHGRHMAAYTLGKPVENVVRKITNMGLRRYPAPKADTRGGVA